MTTTTIRPSAKIRKTAIAIVLGTVFRAPTVGFALRYLIDTNKSVENDADATTVALHIQPEPTAKKPATLASGRGSASGAARNSAFGLWAALSNRDIVLRQVDRLVRAMAFVFLFPSRGGGSGTGAFPLLLQMVRDAISSQTALFVCHAIYPEAPSKVLLSLADRVRYRSDNPREVHVLGTRPDLVARVADLSAGELDAVAGEWVNLTPASSAFIDFGFVTVAIWEPDLEEIARDAVRSVRRRMGDRLERGLSVTVADSDMDVYEANLRRGLEDVWDTINRSPAPPETVVANALSMGPVEGERVIKDWAGRVIEESDLDAGLAAVERSLYRVGLERSARGLDETLVMLNQAIDTTSARAGGNEGESPLLRHLADARAARRSLTQGLRHLKQGMTARLRGEKPARPVVRQVIGVARALVQHELAVQAAEVLEGFRDVPSEIRAESDVDLPDGAVVVMVQDAVMGGLDHAEAPLDLSSLDDVVNVAIADVLQDPVGLLCAAALQERDGALQPEFAPSPRVRAGGGVGVVVASPYAGAADAVSKALGYEGSPAIDVPTDGWIRVTVFARVARLGDSEVLQQVVRTAAKAARLEPVEHRVREVKDVHLLDVLPRDEAADDDRLVTALLYSALVPNGLTAEKDRLTISLGTGTSRFSSLDDLRQSLTWGDELALSDAFWDRFAESPTSTKNALERLAKDGPDADRYAKLAALAGVGQVRLERARRDLDARMTETQSLLS